MTTTILRYAAADADFRSELLERPADFGVTSVPAGVEQPDAEALGYWTEGVAAVDIYACASTCSSGPFTFVCDGTTKG
ncbi:cinnamycin family lantibiotic [Actinomadura harenae]|uniref:Cinnamycin family lantibiotic n=1 Tax=Actinomadura harenae TaxID=2483351 RepID=A0A3M2LXM9_9ACTN|nr:cinnamycin family lantibiotic [Actinomadura harenae]RMI41670.1 cinnamycin family lantibiotic [Actinomadura harenae]